MISVTWKFYILKLALLQENHFYIGEKIKAISKCHLLDLIAGVNWVNDACHFYCFCWSNDVFPGEELVWVYKTLGGNQWGRNGSPKHYHLNLWFLTTFHLKVYLKSDDLCVTTVMHINRVFANNSAWFFSGFFHCILNKVSTKNIRTTYSRQNIQICYTSYDFMRGTVHDLYLADCTLSVKAQSL